MKVNELDDEISVLAMTRSSSDSGGIVAGVVVSIVAVLVVTGILVAILYIVRR